MKTFQAMAVARVVDMEIFYLSDVVMCHYLRCQHTKHDSGFWITIAESWAKDDTASPEIRINGDRIAFKSNVKYLGIQIDCHFPTKLERTYNCRTQ